MNIEELENKIKLLTAKLSSESFVYDLLLVYGPLKNASLFVTIDKNFSASVYSACL